MDNKGRLQKSMTPQNFYQKLLLSSKLIKVTISDKKELKKIWNSYIALSKWLLPYSDNTKETVA